MYCTKKGLESVFILVLTHFSLSLCLPLSLSLPHSRTHFVSPSVFSCPPCPLSLLSPSLPLSLPQLTVPVGPNASVRQTVRPAAAPAYAPDVQETNASAGTSASAPKIAARTVQRLHRHCHPS